MNEEKEGLEDFLDKLPEEEIKDLNGFLRTIDRADLSEEEIQIIADIMTGDFNQGTEASYCPNCGEELG